MKEKRNTTHPVSWVPSLYFAEALPYMAVMTLSTIMYTNLGLTNTELALYTSWLYLPWVIKPIWSPLVDSLKTKRWWILIMQVLIGASLAGVALTLQTELWLKLSLAFFWLMAFSSATHDIAADGFYILGLTDKEQAFYVGWRSTFYRIGTIFCQGGLVVLAGMLQKEHDTALAWCMTMAATAIIMIALAAWHNFALPHPDEHNDSRTPAGNPHIARNAMATLYFYFKDTLVAFFSKKGIVSAVLFMLLGRILGGWLVSRTGLKRWWWPMIAAISLPDAVYIYLAMAQPSSLLTINSCVAIEQFGYGFGFTAYMLFLVYFSKGERSTSVFSICTALQALGMMLPGMIAGYLADLWGFSAFFWWVMACCLITVVVSTLVKPHDLA